VAVEDVGARKALDSGNMSDVMFCPDCATNLDAVPTGEVCPGCKGSNRSAIASPGAAESAATADRVTGIVVTKADNRPWVEKWQMVLHSLDKVCEVYANSNGLGTIEIECRVDSFFVECDHLRDWLLWDTSLPAITETTIDRKVDSTAALSLCRDICNTHKHHTRRSGRTARVRGVAIDAPRATVAIEVDWALPAATTVDALQLAEDCVQSWRDFFDEHGINTP